MFGKKKLRMKMKLKKKWKEMKGAKLKEKKK